ncbi:lytic murein transglycosylase [Spiribacter onubensis]|uniref:Lytic murein transglycosylase n=1 Tax=Spiribacter onubensis TaxID=3122420 RepID=A0ABV3SAC6_9GAMM
MTACKARQIVACLFLAGLFPASAAAGFGECIGEIRSEAISRGIEAATADQLLADLAPSERVIELDRRQPEFTATLNDYLTARVNDARIDRGRALLDEHAELLQGIRRDYGVPGRYLIAFWGLETNFGSYTGRMPTVQSLATLACDRRRGEFFREQLLAALHLVDERILEPEQLRGSWAGALGNFQFLPSVYRDHAVDADGDGRKDLWDSLPDAAVSAAAFLRARGWEPGERWGREVQLPDGFDYALAERKQSLRAWRDAGLRTADGGPLPVADLAARLLIPAGADGPAFLVYNNFDVIMRWNPSRFYALSVGLLADRLIGAPPLSNPPPVEEPLRIETVSALQEALNRRGFDAGAVDGRIGTNTRRALRAFQADAGLVDDGHPDTDTLEELGINQSGR